MDTLIVFILLGSYVTYLLTMSEILAGFRNFLVKNTEYIGQAITCPQCACFWVGFILSVLFVCIGIGSPSANVLDVPTLLGSIFDGFLIGCSVSIIYK